jgi:hypothetical protein
MPIDRRDPATRGTQSRGRCHLYVLPCTWEDLLKLGFSRDPLARMQQLHPRWYEFFDLERALAIETESVPDARKLELQHRRLLEAHNAPAPLTVREDAGGKREWYRGAYGQLADAALDLRDAGHIVHAPLRSWLRHALEQRADQLFSWTSAMLDIEMLATPDPWATPPPTHRTVHDALDAYDALGIDLAPWLPPAVFDWHARQR